MTCVTGRGSVTLDGMTETSTPTAPSTDAMQAAAMAQSAARRIRHATLVEIEQRRDAGGILAGAARAARIARTGEGRVHSTNQWHRAIEQERVDEARAWLADHGRDVADAMVLASDRTRYDLILALTGADG